MSPLTAERIPVSLAIGDDALRGRLLEAMGALPVPLAAEHCPASGQAELLAGIARQRPAVLLLGLPSLACDMGELLASFATLEAAPLVIAVNDSADPPSIVRAMRAGASEFVYPPFDNLAEAFERTAAEWEGTARSSRTAGSTIGFVSAKGGCGVTTVACHTAAFLRACGKDVLLADLDFRAGIACSVMQASARYTLADAMNNLDRMDSTLWKALAAKTPSGVDVLPPPAAPAEWNGASRKLGQLLRFWRLHYDVTIADLGCGLSQPLVEMGDSIDSLVIVATTELAALRQSKQMIETLLRKHAGYKSVRLVVNRVPRRTEMQTPELERIIGYPIYSTLPNDYRTLAGAYADARLLTRDSELGSHIAGLAGKLASVPALEPAKQKRKFALFG